MTRLNFTFQEASPLITYSGWVEGSPANDTFSSSYNGSFRVTFTEGATASLTFSGTAVSLFGATRPNHGNYSVRLDQQPLFEAQGSTATNIFNKSLWHADDLGYTEHTVVLTNILAETGQFLDLDYVSIERQIGQDGDQIYQTTFDDDSPTVKYSGSWEQTRGRSSAYQGTLHTTNVANSQAIITFRGCCLELYGHYANAPYSVILDNQPAVNMAGLNVDLTPDMQHPQTLLYLVDGLSEGNHTVTLTNINSNVNRPFLFDYAVVSSTNNVTSNGTAPPGVAPSGKGKGKGISAPASSHGSPPFGAIIGGSVGGAVAFLAVLILFLFIRRRRQRRADKSHSVDLLDESELEPKPFMLPNHPEAQNTYPGELQHNFPGGGGFIIPSKRHQIADYYPQGASEEGLLSPQEQSQSGESGSYASTSSAARSRTVSQASASQSASTPRRDVKRSVSQSQESHHTTGESVERPAVQEEDAGVVISPDDVPAARSLPPAYNPEWHQRGES